MKLPEFHSKCSRTAFDNEVLSSHADNWIISCRLWFTKETRINTEKAISSIIIGNQFLPSHFGSTSPWSTAADTTIVTIKHFSKITWNTNYIFLNVVMYPLQASFSWIFKNVTVSVQTVDGSRRSKNLLTWVFYTLGKPQKFIQLPYHQIVTVLQRHSIHCFANADLVFNISVKFDSNPHDFWSLFFLQNRSVGFQSILFTLNLELHKHKRKHFLFRQLVNISLVNHCTAALKKLFCFSLFWLRFQHIHFFYSLWECEELLRFFWLVSRKFIKKGSIQFVENFGKLFEEFSRPPSPLLFLSTW